ncbi:MAG: CAP domain-containing protein [Verrucomicrobiales bacterium]|nr:CAP domain-containing protein [Verrucomicrobiales bacterium]
MFLGLNTVRTRLLITFLITTYSANAGLPVDTSNRSDVIRHFFSHYLPSENFEEHHEWTGDMSIADPGQVSEKLHDDVIRRVNYFRAMSGLSSDIVLSEELNAKCQQAAFMMAYNNELDHYPTVDWDHYSESGAEAARNSNLSLGLNTPYYGPTAVDGQIEDSGPNNYSVGHRRWILYSHAPKEMGHGSIPLTFIIPKPEPIPEPIPEPPPTPKNKNSAMVLWVIGKSSNQPKNIPEFIAWPPKGFVPRQVVYERWSFAIPTKINTSTDFSKSKVSVMQAGIELPTEIIYRGNSRQGTDPTLVFEIEGFTSSGSTFTDQNYSVTVSGINGAPKNTYQYEVKIIDPYRLDPIAINGLSKLYEDSDRNYTFTPIKAAEEYELLIGKPHQSLWTEDAEGKNIKTIIDNTKKSYPLLTKGIAKSGTSSFHLSSHDESFEINREIIPSENSKIEFDQLFRYMGDGTFLSLEIRTDTGPWTQVWKRYGKHGYQVFVGDWDNSWSFTSVPLNQFINERIRIRFRYEYESGADWSLVGGDDPNEMGAFIDNVRVTNSRELQPLSSITLESGQTAFEIDSLPNDEYWLQIKAKVSDRWFGYGKKKIIQIYKGIKPELKINHLNRVAAELFEIDITSKGIKKLMLQSSIDGGKIWNNEQMITPESTKEEELLLKIKQRSSSMIYRVIAPN